MPRIVYEFTALGRSGQFPNSVICTPDAWQSVGFGPLVAGHTQFALKPSTGTVLSKSISIIDRDGLTHTLIFNNGLLILHTTA